MATLDRRALRPLSTILALTLVLVVGTACNDESGDTTSDQSEQAWCQRFIAVDTASERDIDAETAAIAEEFGVAPDVDLDTIDPAVRQQVAQAMADYAGEVYAPLGVDPPEAVADDVQVVLAAVPEAVESQVTGETVPQARQAEIEASGTRIADWVRDNCDYDPQG
jgi:hypothetical protein